jgi:serine/threonine protein kinase
MSNDDFLLSSSKKAFVKEPSLKELVERQSKSSSDVCENISSLPGFLKKFSRGGSSWVIYSISTDPTVLLKYVDFSLFKSQDLSRSKSRIGTYIKHIESEIKVNILLKANRNSVQNVLVPIEIGVCDTEEQPYYIIMDKCDTSLDKALELLVDLKMVKKILIDIIVSLISIQRLGIIHNDLEPRNILFKDGNVLLSDFGMSTLAEAKVSDLKGISTIRSEIEDEFIFYDIAMLLSYLYTKNRVVILEKIGVDLTQMYTSIAEDLFLKYKTLGALLDTVRTAL